MEGRVVGINASIRTVGRGGEDGSIGLGFAIPIDEVLPIIDQMKDGETPTHARLGISVSDAADTSGAEVVEGAKIQEITDGSAADDAGLKKGDVITRSTTTWSAAPTPWSRRCAPTGRATRSR